MIQNYDYINFVPGIKKSLSHDNNDLCFIFCEGKMLFFDNDDNVTIPTWSLIEKITMNITFEQYFGLFYKTHCYVFVISDYLNLPKNFHFKDLRTAGLQLNNPLFEICGKASEIVTWNESNKYCGKCGDKMHQSFTERVKVCNTCGNLSYPHITPAIIVAVLKEEKILLAHNKNFRPGLYSIIAGFVEPGETLEECVKREIYEEVGIKVKNINYFNSQPWPFPNSLMIGFTADYESGEIQVDGEEIIDADWYKFDNIPNIPTNISIARQIIDAFKDRKI